MRVYIDRPKVFDMKNKTRSLSFSLIETLDGGIAQVIPGLRIMDGFIHPPRHQVSKTRQWVPSVYFSRDVAGLIYEQVQMNSWATRYQLTPLLEEEKAIIPLLITTEIAAQVAPAIV